VLRLVPSRFLGRRLLPAGRDRLAEPTHVADRTPPFGPCEALSLDLRALSDAPRKREAPGSNPPGSSTTPPSSPSTSARATISSGARKSSSISSSGGHTWRTCSRSTRVATEPRSGPRTRLPGSSSRSGTWDRCAEPRDIEHGSAGAALPAPCRRSEPRLPGVRFGRGPARAGEELVELAERFLVELDLRHAHHLVELLERARPDDRGGHDRVRQ